MSGVTARAFCWNGKATLRNKGNKDSQNNTDWNCVCLHLNLLFGGSSLFTYNTVQVPTKVSSMLVLLNFWRNHLVLCLENLLPSPLCWREKPCFHPCMLKTSSKSIPAYYCASKYRLRVHKIFTTFLLLPIIICHELCFREKSAWSPQICSNYSIWMNQCVENSSSQLIHHQSYFQSCPPSSSPCCISHVLFTSFVSNHYTQSELAQYSKQEKSDCKKPTCFSMAIQTAEVCFACLSSVTRAAHWVKDKMMCWLNHTHHLYDKPFCKDQLYIYISGSWHSKERQSNSFSIE